MKAKFQRREVMLMLWPVAAILGLGWYLSGQHLQKSSPTHPSPLSVEISEVSRYAPLNDRILVHFKIRHHRPWLGKAKIHIWRFTGGRVLDKSGQQITAPFPLRYDGMRPQSSGIFTLSDNLNGLYSFTVSLQPNQLFGKTGLTYVSQLSLDNAPPISVRASFPKEIEWTLRRSSLLKLGGYSASLVNNGANHAAYEVIQKFVYTGKTLLSLRDVNGYLREFTHYISGNSSENIKHLPIAQESGKMRFFSKGRERIEPAKGFLGDGHEMVWIRDAQFDTSSGAGTIDYIISFDKLPLKGPLWLIAKIGVENDGFLAIKIPVRNAAGQWLTHS